MNNVHERIGKRLKALREARGLSQAQLAKLCGYSSASRIGNYELGVRKISVDDAIRIGPALGISAADLLFGNDNPLDKHAYKENFLSKIEENLLEMFNELPQKEKDNFIKAINTRKNELDQLYEEMKAVKERKGKRA